MRGLSRTRPSERQVRTNPSPVKVSKEVTNDETNEAEKTDLLVPVDEHQSPTFDFEPEPPELKHNLQLPNIFTTETDSDVSDVSSTPEVIDTAVSVQTQNLSDFCATSPEEFCKFCQNLLESRKYLFANYSSVPESRSEAEKGLFDLLEQDGNRLNQKLSTCRDIIKQLLPQKQKVLTFFAELYPAHPKVSIIKNQYKLLACVYQQLQEL
jgi:hypothetical protein